MIYPFLAGFIATLTFHQGTLALLYQARLWPKPPLGFGVAVLMRVFV